jgi:hypothetical protein
MKRHGPAITFRHGLEKSPASGRLEIARQSCSTTDFLEIGRPSGHPGRGRNRAFHNPAPAAAVIPGWPANPGLRSSRAVEVSWPGLLATSPSLCAISSPANRSNSLGALSPLATVAGRRGKAVFTQTQMTRRFNIFRLAVLAAIDRNSSKPE